MFNLKLYQKENNKKAQYVQQVETRLRNKNEELDTEAKPEEELSHYQRRLEDDRSMGPEEEIYEKWLDQSRKANGDQKITEGAMNDRKDPVNGMDVRSDEGQPPMDYAKDFVNESEQQFTDMRQSEKRDTSFWDDFVGHDVDNITKIVKNVAPSQLLSNYDSREDFEKENRPVKNNKKKVEALSKLRDADALLYSIYRTASSQNRPLTKKEKQQVSDITSSKIRILSGLPEDPDFWTGMLEDTQNEADMVNDDEKKRQEIYKKQIEFLNS